MLNNRGFDLWADDYDKSVGLSDEGGTYPFAGYKDILIKIKDNKIQSTLNKQQRIENVKNAYKLKNIQIIKQKNILIIDDIYTTGATVNECAKVLKQQNCNVSIITIAKDF